MALFSRKSRTTKLAEAVAQELAKANSMGATPMGGSGYSTSAAANPAGMGMVSPLELLAQQTVPLSRLADAFGSQLGPSAPFLPTALDPVLDETGRALPRLYEYPVAWNLNLSNERGSAPWSVLRALADQCDIIHRAIEIKVAEVVKMKWTFKLSNEAINEIMATHGVSHSRAAKIGRDKYDSEINRLTRFWENPYPQSDRTWSEWITEFLWQHLVFDGVPVYPRINLGKEVMGFDIIDAPTIKVLLDNRGGLPQPPNPAFQQILWGFPRGEYEASVQADGEYFSGTGHNGEFITDQLAYFVRNRRTWSPYGFSSVEASIPAATLYLNRQKWLNSEYQDGTLPVTFMETDSDELDHLKLAGFERVFNDTLTGSTAERHRIKVLPKGFHPTFAPDPSSRFASDYDEFLIKRIAGFFGISPSAIGLTPRNGIGGAGQQNGEQESSEIIGIRPMENFLEDTINSLCRRFLSVDKGITFSLSDHESTKDEQAKATAFQTALFSGAMTLNDVRGEMGLPLYDMPEADEPFIVQGKPNFLSGSIGRSEAAMGALTAAPNATSGQESVSEGLSPAAQESGSENADKPETEANPSNIGKAEMDEIFAYTRFLEKRVKAGTWRDFQFEVLDETRAKQLNAEGCTFVASGIMPRDIPKGGSPTKPKVEDLPFYDERVMVEDAYTPLILKAMQKMFSGISAAVNLAYDTAAYYEATDKLDTKVIARNAVSQAINSNFKPLTEVLQDLMLDGFELGRDATDYLLGNVQKADSRPIALTSSRTETALGNYWRDWTPGSKRTSGLLDNNRLAQTFADMGFAAKGISTVTLDRIGNQLAESIKTGDTPRKAIRQINDIIGDNRRANIIAITETNRAYCQSSVNTMQTRGIKGWVWHDYEGACPVCVNEAGDGRVHTYSEATPPKHPSCRCVPLAAMPDYLTGNITDPYPSVVEPPVTTPSGADPLERFYASIKNVASTKAEVAKAIYKYEGIGNSYTALNKVMKRNGSYALHTTMEVTGGLKKALTASYEELLQLESEGWTTVFRGVMGEQSIAAKFMLENTRLAEAADVWVGKGIYTDGFYTSNRVQTGLHYAGKEMDYISNLRGEWETIPNKEKYVPDESAVQRMVIHPDAKSITDTDLWDALAQIDRDDGGTGSKREGCLKLLKSKGYSEEFVINKSTTEVLGMAAREMGYDFIKVPQLKAGVLPEDEEVYYIILNRTAVVFQKEASTIEQLADALNGVKLPPSTRVRNPRI